MQQATWLAAAVMAGFLGGAGARVLPVLAQSGEKSVTARAFILVDEQGNQRGEFRVNEQGQAFLRLYDGRGGLSWSAPPPVRILPLH